MTLRIELEISPKSEDTQILCNGISEEAKNKKDLQPVTFFAFQEVWKSLILERFLVRLANSSYHDKLIFKGGFLLAHYIHIARETSDIDLLARKLKAEMKNIESAFLQICKVEVNDEFTMSLSDISMLDHTHMNYVGFQVRLNAQFGKIKDRIYIDVGVGDAVEPYEKSFKLSQY